MISASYAWLLLSGILLMYAAEDILRHRISNGNILIGLAAGLLLCTGSVKDLVIRLISLLAVFLFGMLNLLSMGDLKVLMVIAAFLGLSESIRIVFLACVLLILYSFLDGKEESASEIRLLLLTWTFPQQGLSGTKAYPFVPFLFAGCVGVHLLAEL